jgi:hypothetical protein
VSVLWQHLLIALYAVAVLVHNLACLAWLVAGRGQSTAGQLLMVFAYHT